MIFKKRLHDKYTAISNDICCNTAISTDARWCLWYLLTKPQDWEVRIGDIRNVSGWGRDKAKNVISELVAARYVVKRQERSDCGQFDVNAYDVYSEPMTDAPVTENPSSDKPSTADTSLTKDLKGLKTKKEQKTEKNILVDQRFDADFEEFWAAYPKRTPHSNPKHPARLKYASARRALSVSRETLLLAVKKYATSVATAEPQHIAQAQTWLNQRRWEDDNGSPADIKISVPLASDEQLDAVVKVYPGVVSDRMAARKHLAAELAKGTGLEEIIAAATKFRIHMRQMRESGMTVAEPILETWLKFKWREMDAYEIYSNPVERRPILRPVKGKRQ